MLIEAIRDGNTPEERVQALRQAVQRAIDDFKGVSYRVQFRRDGVLREESSVVIAINGAWSSEGDVWIDFARAPEMPTERRKCRKVVYVDKSKTRAGHWVSSPVGGAEGTDAASLPKVLESMPTQDHPYMITRYLFGDGEETLADFMKFYQDYPQDVFIQNRAEKSYIVYEIRDLPRAGRDGPVFRRFYLVPQGKMSCNVVHVEQWKLNSGMNVSDVTEYYDLMTTSGQSSIESGGFIVNYPTEFTINRGFGSSNKSLEIALANFINSSENPVSSLAEVSQQFSPPDRFTKVVGGINTVMSVVSNSGSLIDSQLVQLKSEDFEIIVSGQRSIFSRLMSYLSIACGLALLVAVALLFLRSVKSLI